MFSPWKDPAMLSRPRLATTLPLVALLLARATLAQSGAAPAPSCTAPEYRHDFWLGRWDVTLPNGKPAGTNRIEPILGGCALRESWTGVCGHQGTSYNVYDASRQRWHQTWVDDQGNLLELDGRFSDGKMTLSGETLDSTGSQALQRITWEPTAPGKVRQLWESSTDGGRSWTVAFDGRYLKR
jgi:hypothetical protein